MSVFGGGIDTGGPRGDKGLSMGLVQILRLAWADEELRGRLMFVFWMFVVFAIGVHVPVPIPGISAESIQEKLKDNTFLELINAFGGGALRRISVFSLGLNPYITSSIIMQILTQANPAWKKEQKEEGEYARRKMNKRTRGLMLLICVVQSLSFIRTFSTAGIAELNNPLSIAAVTIYWTAGAMFILWLGEQISERGIGQGTSLMIFAGIIVYLPTQLQQLYQAVSIQGAWWIYAVLAAIFLASTWLVVFFTTAQRRIPIQHARRNVGTKVIGGQTSYLPLTVNTAGVIPIIFAISILVLPAQFASWMPKDSAPQRVFTFLAEWLNPGGAHGRWIVGCLVYVLMIFVFSYFYTAIQYNVEDMADHLKRADSYIPGIRPGKQTREFLDSVISRVTVIGAAFLAVIALTQYLGPAVTQTQRVSIIGGTTLLIVVSVALDTLRQIEANLLYKQYGQ